VILLNPNSSGNDTAFAFPYDTFIAGIQNRAVSAAANPHFVLFDNNGKLELRSCKQLSRSNRSKLRRLLQAYRK
jgi:hypothetical protein